MGDDARIESSFECKGRRVVLQHPRWEDAEAYGEMLNALHDESQHAPVWVPTRPYDRAGAADKLVLSLKKEAFGRGQVVFVWIDGVLQGQGWVDFNQSNFGKDFATIAIELLAGARGMGIGPRVLDILERKAAASGTRALLLTVCSENPAMGLYAGRGYGEVGRKRHFMSCNHREQPFDQRPDLVEMVKWL